MVTCLHGQVVDTVIHEEIISVEPGASEDEGVLFQPRGQQEGYGGPRSLRSRHLPDSLMEKMKKDDAFWYVDYSFENESARKARPEERRVPFLQRPLAQTILWIVIVAGFIVFVGIYLANSNVGVFRRRNKSIREEWVSGEIPEDIFEINYERELERAIANGDFRLGVRLLFLRLLKNLSEKKIISYKQDRTNFDYILQLQGSRHYQGFFRLTRNYEYSWYGQFSIGRQEFDSIKDDFEKFDEQLTRN